MGSAGLKKIHCRTSCSLIRGFASDLDSRSPSCAIELNYSKNLPKITLKPKRFLFNGRQRIWGVNNLALHCVAYPYSRWRRLILLNRGRILLSATTNVIGRISYSRLTSFMTFLPLSFSGVPFLTSIFDLWSRT